MFKSKKYTCIFCSDVNENSKNKIMFCKNCKTIRNFLHQYGMKALLEIIEKPSAPPY